MSDWFFEKEIEEEIEFSNIENQGFTSPIYEPEKTWLDSEWSGKVLEIITNPAIIIATIITCSILILILGGYNA